MSFKLNTKKSLCHLSEKVKSVDMHSEYPWVQASLYNGTAQIYNYEDQTTLKSIDVSNNALRCGVFVERKQWVVFAGDDTHVHVYNYNTMEQVADFEAHNDFVRNISVHGIQDCMLTSSDSHSVKLWNWDSKANFTLQKEYLEHSHFVMQVKFNPKEANFFATASLDRTIKIWNMGIDKSNITLSGHTHGVNCIDFSKDDKPLIVSGSDDKTVKVWDYKERTCLFTLEGHENCVSAVLFHPDMPHIFSGSEDGNVLVWNRNTMKVQSTMSYYMQKVWGLSCNPNQADSVAIGYDEGTVVVKMSSDESKASISNGKLIYAKNYEILGYNLKAIPKDDQKDECLVPFSAKELGFSDVYPLTIKHSPNGLSFVITDQSEYVIYKSQTFNNLSFGNGAHFCWANNGGYAVKRDMKVAIYDNNHQEVTTIKTDYPIEDLYGGPLLSIKSTDFILFYDWDTYTFISKIDVSGKDIFWNTKTGKFIISAKDGIYNLIYNKELVEKTLKENENLDDGIEDAFELLFEFNDVVTSGCWIDDTFFYINVHNKQCYIAKGKIFTYCYLPRGYKQLGHVSNHNRIFLLGSKNRLMSYELPIAFSEAISLQSQDDMNIAKQLGKLAHGYHDKIARFLDGIDMKEKAFEIVKSVDFKFDLALQLNLCDDALDICRENAIPKRWKQVGDLCLNNGRFDDAEECYRAASDNSSLFLLYSSLGDQEGLDWLAKDCLERKIYNIAFNSFQLLREVDMCVSTLIQAKRFPEAAFFAKAYAPSHITEIVKLWKISLLKSHPLTSHKLADPMEYEEDYEQQSYTKRIEMNIKEKIKVEVGSERFEEFKEQLKQDLLINFGNEEASETLLNSLDFTPI